MGIGGTCLPRCNKKTAGKKYWMCMICGCSITVHTNEDKISLRAGKSNHDPESSTDLIKTTRLRRQTKQRALTELKPINGIYKKVMTRLSLKISLLSTFPINQENCEWMLDEVSLRKLCVWFQVQRSPRLVEKFFRSFLNHVFSPSLTSTN